MRGEGKITRFYHKYTNVSELEKFQKYHIDTYILHVVAVNTDKGTTRSQMLRYMRVFPLGVVQPERSDTIYYKNVNAMTKVIE